MWRIEATEKFWGWYDAQSRALQLDVLAAIDLLKEWGPQLGRPHVDTLNGTTFGNLKELRIQSQGHPIRACFIFNPERRAVLLCAANKQGCNEKRFYKSLIDIAENEYINYLKHLKRDFT